jgi:diacylglycerol O-acyltransferase
MPPTDSLFLLAESRNQPMHVGGLQLFVPPDGADAFDLRRRFDAEMGIGEVAPLFGKRPRRAVTTLGQWGWEPDRALDLRRHVRHHVLPAPGRVLDLLSLCSALHSSRLDRDRPLWELHLIEGLADGRLAVYFKVHHALVDGVSALRLLARTLSPDPALRSTPAPWVLRPGETGAAGRGRVVEREPLDLIADAAGVVPALARTVARAVTRQSAPLSLSAPRSVLNVPISGQRRFAAQSWPIDRLQRIGRASDTTLNDVVLALCSGALRRYLIGQHALPESPMIAMVPVSLHGELPRTADGGGNNIGVVMCNLGTHRADPGERLATVHHSMVAGKEALQAMSPLQILATSALGVSPLAIWPLLRLTGRARPPFNLVISNVVGPRQPLYWNGARLDGLYPLSIPLEGQALNITCTSYADAVAFGLTGCRCTVPHLQRLLTHLDEELAALEQAVGI